MSDVPSIPCRNQVPNLCLQQEAQATHATQMQVYIHTPKHTHVCKRKRTCTQHTHADTCTHMHTHATQMKVNKHTPKHTHVCNCTCTKMHSQTHTCKQAHMNTAHTHAHTSRHIKYET